MTAREAARIGFINHAVRADELDVRVARHASMLDASVDYELLTNYADNHQEAMAAFSSQRMPVFGGAS